MPVYIRLLGSAEYCRRFTIQHVHKAFYFHYIQVANLFWAYFYQFIDNQSIKNYHNWAWMQFFGHQNQMIPSIELWAEKCPRKIWIQNQNMRGRKCEEKFAWKRQNFGMGVNKKPLWWQKPKEKKRKKSFWQQRWRVIVSSYFLLPNNRPEWCYIKLTN